MATGDETDRRDGGGGSDPTGAHDRELLSPGVVTVAILDDHRLVTDALISEFHATDGVRVAWSGESRDVLIAAMEPEGEAAGQVDVVLLDLELGDDRADPQLVLRLRELGAQVLVVSAVADPVLLRSLFPFGIGGVVRKTEPLPTLLAAIRCVARGEQWHSPQVAAALLDSPTVDFPALSEQEQRVLIMVASGLKLASVARRLGISVNTVKDYLKRIRAKHAAAGRPTPTLVDLHREAVRRGLVDP